MATKAELEAELADLRKKLADTKADAKADDAPEPDEDPPASTGGLAGILAEHDVKTEDLEDLWNQLVKELDGLPQRKPLLTAAAAFALGFILGRASK